MSTHENNGWIRCDDRLPQGDDPVLVWHGEYLADNLLQIATSNPEFVRLHWRNWFTHWQPAPSGPTV